MKMSGKSTGYRHVHRARPPVLSQAGVEKYATGCGKLSMPSKHLDRLTKTHNLNQKNTEIKTVINTKKNSIGSINLQTAKEEL